MVKCVLVVVLFMVHLQSFSVVEKKEADRLKIAPEKIYRQPSREQAVLMRREETLKRNKKLMSEKDSVAAQYKSDFEDTRLGKANLETAKFKHVNSKKGRYGAGGSLMNTVALILFFTTLIIALVKIVKNKKQVSRRVVYENQI